MTNQQKTNTQSKFNFFAILEDTISGVIEFFLRFVGVTLLCLFRPGLCITRYRQAGELPAGVFPRPYTYLVLCIFVFIKGLHLISQSTPAGPDKLASDSSFLVKTHEFVDKLGDITTIQIILSVFPTVVVILFLSLVVSLLHRPFTQVDYRQASHAFSYIFGAQIIGALSLIVLIISLGRLGILDLNVGLAVTVTIISVIALALSSTLSLKAWYDIRAKHVLAKLGLYLPYVLIVLAVGLAYFSTMIAAYSELEYDAAGTGVSGQTLSSDKGVADAGLNLTIYQDSVNSNQVSFSILLENRSDRPYLLHDKGSAVIMNVSENQLKKITAPDEPTDVHLELIREYLKRLESGFFRVTLTQVQDDPRIGRLIRPGEQRFVTFQGKVAGGIVVSESFSSELSLPVARFNADGSVTYTTITQKLGASYRDMHTNLEIEKLRSDRKIDEQVAKAQQLFDDTLRQLEKTLEKKQAEKATGSTKK